MSDTPKEMERLWGKRSDANAMAWAMFERDGVIPDMQDVEHEVMAGVERALNRVGYEKTECRGRHVEGSTERWACICGAAKKSRCPL